MSEKRDISITIAPGSIITALLFIVGAGLLFYLRDLVLIVLTAIVLASAIEPAVLFFMRHRFSRILSVLLVYALFVSSVALVGFLFVPPVLDDAAGFLTNLPTTLQSLELASGLASDLPGGIGSGLSPAQLADAIRGTFASFTGGLFTTVSAFFGGIVSLGLIIIFSFYFAVQETGIDDFLRLVVPVRHQQYALSLWKRSQEKIGKWMQGQLLLALLVGVLLYLGLVILGVPYALLLAVIAALFELIPVFGQFLAAIPAIAIAFADGGATGALLVIGLYAIVQQFESNLIYPLVVKKVVGVPPILVILALLIGGSVAGFLGVLLSVPIAAALQEFINDVQKNKERELARLNTTHG